MTPIDAITLALLSIVVLTALFIGIATLMVIGHMYYRINGKQKVN